MKTFKEKVIITAKNLGIKYRRHHNNKGLRQIRLGNTRNQVRAMARRLGIKYCETTDLKT